MSFILSGFTFTPRRNDFTNSAGRPDDFRGLAFGLRDDM